MTPPTITRKQSSFIKSLFRKKNRQQTQCFVVEGAKSCFTFWEGGYTPFCIVATPTYLATATQLKTSTCSLFLATPTQLANLGSFKVNNELLVVFHYPAKKASQLPTAPQKILVLDDIQDPGNLGTLIRIADWYGLDSIIVSPHTVDCYNSKVIQASMGSLAHIPVHYRPLVPYLTACQKEKIPILGGVVAEEQSTNKATIPPYGCLVIGNESHGISPAVRALLTHSVSIARYGKAESLNAAIAGAILCDWWVALH